MLEPQLTKQIINNVREKLVHDIFCPADTRSCSPVMGKRVYELCFATGITTVGQLADMNDDQMRAKSFSTELIDYIDKELAGVRTGFGALPSAFINAAKKSASTELTPEQAQLYAEHNGAGDVWLSLQIR